MYRILNAKMLMFDSEPDIESVPSTKLEFL